MLLALGAIELRSALLIEVICQAHDHIRSLDRSPWLHPEGVELYST